MVKPKILFMGTAEFAHPSLEALIRGGHSVIGIVTQPDRPKGRGRQFVAPPVKDIAERHQLPVIQPERVRDPDFVQTFRTLAPDMVVLVAFGQILPKEVIQFPRMGCINVHPSLLPKYRGAAPIQWALIRGELETGVTTIMMDEGVDTGDILLQRETVIEPDENFDRLHDRLALMGAEVLAETIEGLLQGKIHRRPQDPAQASNAPRLKKEDGLIRWDAGVREIKHFIAGLSSTPGAYTYLLGKMMKIFSAGAIEAPVAERPGTIIKTPGGLRIAAKNGYLEIRELQLESKKRMTAVEFLRGHRIESGELAG
ncbi:MAG: methionyl-tRNA formyltransferase [Deltaproteobacteria bacterium]|nr:methionyl-tRNA formyltransferase [Deltaproteobacteria bacterium]